MRAIIVEDEFPARKELRYLVENNSSIEVINEFTNGVDVLSFIQENTIDVIFLDINIPRLDGMLLAKIISQFKNPPQIVFITAYENYAVDAFSLDILDYILKPYSEERIVSMLKKLEKIVQEDNKLKDDKYYEISSKISLWKGDKIVVLDINDIYYCEANKRHTLIYTNKDKFVYRKGITEVEKIIDNNKFFRTHRSYLVNLSRIEEIIPWFNNTYILKLNAGKYEVSVSRSRIKEFRTLMHI